MATAVQHDPTEPPVRRAPHLKLYEATEALDIVHEMIIEAGGELTPEIEELLGLATGDFDEKAQRVALKVKELEATEAAEKAQADSISQTVVAFHLARSRSAGTAAKSLKAYLCRELIKAGGEAGPRSIKGKLAALRVQKNSKPSVKVTTTDPSFLERLWALSTRWATKKVDYTLNSDEVLLAAKLGEQIPEGIAIEQGYHVRIS